MNNVIMTRQLADKLIAKYEMALVEANKCTDVYYAIMLMKKLNVHDGICGCSLMELDIDIFHCPWVNKRKNGGGYYWFKTPQTCINISELNDALQTRIQILKQFPN